MIREGNSKEKNKIKSEENKMQQADTKKQYTFYEFECMSDEEIEAFPIENYAPWEITFLHYKHAIHAFYDPDGSPTRWNWYNFYMDYLKALRNHYHKLDEERRKSGVFVA